MPDPGFHPRDALDTPISALANRGHRVAGPPVRNEAVIDGTLRDAALPRYLRDQQAPGHYQLKDSGSRCFAWTHGTAD